MLSPLGDKFYQIVEVVSNITFIWCSDSFFEIISNFNKRSSDRLYLVEYVFQIMCKNGLKAVLTRIQFTQIHLTFLELVINSLVMKYKKQGSLYIRKRIPLSHDRYPQPIRMLE